MANRKSAGDHKSQRERFIEAARAAGTDEDESAFKAKLAVIARQKPKGDDQKGPKAKGKHHGD